MAGPRPDPELTRAGRVGASLAQLVAAAESTTGSAAEAGAALATLLARDPRVGAATVLGILSLGPRYQPSRGLLIDPHDDVHRRWERRVAATRALLASPALLGVVDELADELADSPELCRAVVAADGIDPAWPAVIKELLVLPGG